MPMDLSNPTGFNKFWAEAIDDHLDGGNLDAVNEHITGAVDPDTLAAQYAFPVVWSVPTNHSPDYATVATDQGTLSFQVVTLAADTDPDIALQKARTLGGRIVNNVEGSALVDDSGTAHAARVDLDDFQLDSRPISGQGAQVKYCELAFAIRTERRYP
jgi:hypothetical protein